MAELEKLPELRKVVDALLERVDLLEEQIKSLDPSTFTASDRLDKVEEKQAVLVLGLQWAANEVRPIYGMGYLGKVLDGVVVRLSK